ncbi:hypothetical protein ScPMuIL_009586 [Solemya velum]
MKLPIENGRFCSDLATVAPATAVSIAISNQLERGVVLNLSPCKVCGRKFVAESLAKHEPACIKNSKKSRKVFDSTKQRVQGTDLNLRQVKQAQKKDIPPPKSNWRVKHEQFIDNIRNAKGVSKAIEQGKPLPPPPPPTIDPDYIQCPYCERRFNQKAAERHISFCKEQKSRLKPAIDPKAKSRQNARLQYPVPKPSSKGSSPAMNPGPVGPSATRTPGGQAARTPGGPASRTPPGPSSRIPGGPAARNTPQNTKSGAQQPGGRGAATAGKYQASDYIDYADTFDVAPASRTQVANKNIKTKTNCTPVRGLNSASSQRSQGSVRVAIRGTSAKMNRFKPGDDTGMTDKEPESAYLNSKSENGINRTPYNFRGRQTGNTVAHFCHECGSNYPVPAAKFCCECGVRRIKLS